MGYFDYSREPQSDIAFVDMESSFHTLNTGIKGLHIDKGNITLCHEPGG